MTREDMKTPSEEYFYRNVLQISSGIDEPGTVVWQLALCLLLVWIIIFLVLIKGISSLGKVVYFTSTFPYLMMTVMVVRGATLEGALKGVKFYLQPQWDRLLVSEVWSDAAAQIFYSLSTCSGGLIAMASYNSFKNNSYRDSFLIPVVNCVTSVFAGFSIFTVLGYIATLKDLEVKDVAAGGPGLVFVVYPEGLATMPLAPLWSVLFFFMMLTLGFSSSFSLAEVVFVAVLDEFPQKLRATPYTPIIFRGVACCLYFLVSLPMLTNNTVRKMREIDSREKKIARHRNHMLFSLRCRDEGVTPPSLKIKCGIKTQNASDIIKKAEKDLIRVVRKRCEQELIEYEEEIDNSLPFLETHMVRQEDETVKLLVYRLKTHTDQYLNFTYQKRTEQKRESTVIEHKSATTDQADRNNCIIDWEGATVIDRECNGNARWIKEIIWIRKITPVMNRDEE
ncbi:Sodium-dependent proline transporter [Lamellibrachia satsuma]|nr:Sodium-dependent proline transporter [Lamellibrachia satsuma]